LTEEFALGSARSQHADRFREAAVPTLGFLSSLYPGDVPQLRAVGQSVEESSGNRIMAEGLREIGRYGHLARFGVELGILNLISDLAFQLLHDLHTWRHRGTRCLLDFKSPG
jgi:hypothetical protein